MTEAKLNGPPPAPSRGPHPRTTPIVPERSVAGRTLMFLIAIMTFLSCVTLGGVFLVQKSAIAWSSDVGREVTIQIKPVEGEDMDSNLRLAVSLANATQGVASARALTIEESQNLLKPWLGAGLDLSTLQIPRMIAVQLSDPQDADISKLETDLRSIKGASLDTHAAWRDQLNTMAGTIVISGVLGLALIVVATVLAIIFATRGAMATNRDIVDVLHFIGASNSFIVNEFQGRFLSIGFRGGLLGGVAAILFFLAITLTAGNVGTTDAGAELGLLFGRFAIGWDGALGIIAVIPVIAAMTAITSRLTVTRFLSQIAS
jgi:cell division transport system permease protein